MQQFHHKPIKKFYLDGQIHDESAISRLRDEYTKIMSLEMRMSGYVPRLDIIEDFTIHYNHHKEIFYFELSIYGTYVGKKQSECILGIDGHKPIYIQKSKSKESSQAQASQ